jgi:hypothetical protein
MQFLISTNFYTFKHLKSIHRDYIWIKEHKSNMLIQVLIALNVVMKILK